MLRRIETRAVAVEIEYLGAYKRPVTLLRRSTRGCYRCVDLPNMGD